MAIEGETGPSGTAAFERIRGRSLQSTQPRPARGRVVTTPRYSSQFAPGTHLGQRKGRRRSRSVAWPLNRFLPPGQGSRLNLFHNRILPSDAPQLLEKERFLQATPTLHRLALLLAQALPTSDSEMPPSAAAVASRAQLVLAFAPFTDQHAPFWSSISAKTTSGKLSHAGGWFASCPK